MHAPTAAGGKAVLQDIQVDLIQPEDLAYGEGAFFLQQAVYDRLGKSNGNTYTLTLEPSFSRPGFGLSALDVASRYDMSVFLGYKLADTKTGDILDSGYVHSVSTFGAPLDPYGREAAEKNATRNIAREAADRLLIRLASYFANSKPFEDPEILDYEAPEDPCD
jgi:hypothetical protein